MSSVVFITGTFISHTCWDEWAVYFESHGYTCIIPPWPHKNASAEELRNRPADDAIADNTIQSLLDHFAGIINGLPERPILIGHSVGGLIVQMLLQRDACTAGIAIHSFPPAGINRFRLSFLKSIWETMMLFTSGRKTYLIPFRKWKYAVANGIDCEQQKELYYKYAIPESKKIIRETFRCTTKIDFRKSHAPLLLISGSNDKLVPASLNYRNYKEYVHSKSVTDYREFKGRTHLVFDRPGWEKEADFILFWLQGINK